MTRKRYCSVPNVGYTDRLGNVFRNPQVDIEWPTRYSEHIRWFINSYL